MKYGDTKLRFELPKHALLGSWNLASVPVNTPKNPSALLRVALEQLSASGFEAALRGKRLGLLLADGTRAWDPELLLSALADHLRPAGSLLAILCTGTHDPESPHNLALAKRVEAQLKRDGLGAEVHIHGAERDPHRLHGVTERGTQVQICSLTDACDLFLVLSDMKHHYFAGYSNPVKYYVPGIASMETARGNHSLAMEPESTQGRHPWHPDEAMRTNPLAEDMLEAFQMVVRERAHFALTTISAGAEASDLRWAGAGRTADAAGRGMVAVDELGSLQLPACPYLVVSAGGAPHDESLYTVQRALEMSRAAVREGGEVLFLAACPNGVGSEVARRNFYEPLCAPLDQIEAPSREDYLLYSHKPVKFAQLIGRLKRLHVHSELKPESIARIHMQPCDDPQSLIDAWVARLQPGEGIGFLDDASKLAIR